MKSIYRFCFDFIFFGHCDLFLRQECFSWLWPNIGWPEMQCGGCPGTRTGSLSPYLCIPLISAGDLQSALDAPSSDRRRHRFCCSSSLSYFVTSASPYGRSSAHMHYRCLTKKKSSSAVMAVTKHEILTSKQSKNVGIKPLQLNSRKKLKNSCFC